MNTEEFKAWALGIAHNKCGVNRFPMPERLRKTFNEWFEQNAVIFLNGNSVAEAEYNLVSKEYYPEPGFCNGNSQRISLDNSIYLYYEGFYRVEAHDYPCRCVQHAFNEIEDYQVKDFTSYSRRVTPTNYYGIKIPVDFIKMRQGKMGEKSIPKTNLSLLLPYFFYVQGEAALMESGGYYQPDF